MTVTSFGENKPVFNRPALKYFASSGSLTVNIIQNANTTIGGNAKSGFIFNSGTKNMSYNTSPDGVTFGNNVLLLPGTAHDLEGFSIHSIGLVHSGQNTTYEVKLW